MERGVGGGFKKRGGRGRVGQRDWVDGLDLKADFTVVDGIVKLAVIGQQVQERVD
jgi:hypothetical protein